MKRYVVTVEVVATVEDDEGTLDAEDLVVDTIKHDGFEVLTSRVDRRPLRLPKERT
jgi:hypothetical protein